MIPAAVRETISVPAGTLAPQTISKDVPEIIYIGMILAGVWEI
jgi:hypothetical protein